MPQTSAFRSWVLILLLVAAVIAAFFPVFRNNLVNWDDQINFYENPRLNPPSADGISWFWQHPYAELYIPVTYTVWGGVAVEAYSAEARGDGTHLSPVPFHVASVVCHGLSAVLVFLILRRLVQAELAAFAAALIWAVHPLQVEAVAWASGLKDLLCGLFSLLVLLQYIWFISPATPKELRRRWFYYAGATVCFALALLCKPSAVALPLSLAAIASIWFRRPWRQLARDLLPWALLAIPIAIVAAMAQGAAAASPIWSRPLIAMDSLAWYLDKLILPFRMGIDYGWSPDWVIRQKWAYFIWLAPAALIVAGFLWRRRFPTGLTAMAIFALMPLPVLGLVRFSFQVYSTVSDHYAYLAMLGPALLIAALLRNQRRWQIAIVVVIATGLASLSYAQSRKWKNSQALFSRAIEVNPRSLAGYRNLAYLLAQQGKVDDAIGEYRLALQARPDDGGTWFNLGNLFLTKKNDPNGAIACYEAAERLMPESARLHTNLGLAYKAVGRPDDANREFVLVFLCTGQEMMANGNDAGAAAQFESALKLAPGNAQAWQQLNEIQQRRRGGE